MKHNNALAAAVAATLGAATGAANAVPVSATLNTVLNYSGNGSAAGDLNSSTATWSYDLDTKVLSQDGGLFNIRFSIVPDNTLFRHSITGLMIGNSAPAAATTYVCTEGDFGGNVGASLCGNYNFGKNKANESTSSWGPGTDFARTLAGDDMQIGPPQTIAGYDNFAQISFNGTNLVLSNAVCNASLPGNANGCSTTGGFNTGFTWNLTSTTVIPAPPAVWLLGTAVAGLAGRRVLKRKTGN